MLVTPHAGRGLKATASIKQGTLIMIAPTIRVPSAQYHNHCIHTVFEDYLFKGKSGDYHLALAHGSIFNYSAKANVNWILNEKLNEIKYYAWKTIEDGSDLFINYGRWGQQYEKELEIKTIKMKANLLQKEKMIFYTNDK